MVALVLLLLVVVGQKTRGAVAPKHTWQQLPPAECIQHKATQNTRRSMAPQACPSWPWPWAPTLLLPVHNLPDG